MSTPNINKKENDKKIIEFPATERETGDEPVDLVGAVQKPEDARRAANAQARRRLRTSKTKPTGAMEEAVLPSGKALDHPIYLLEDAVKLLRKARPKIKAALTPRGRRH